MMNATTAEYLRSRCSQLNIHQQFYMPHAIVVAEGAHALVMLCMAAGHQHLPGGTFQDDSLEMLEEYVLSHSGMKDCWYPGALSRWCLFSLTALRDGIIPGSNMAEIGTPLMVADRGVRAGLMPPSEPFAQRCF